LRRFIRCAALGIAALLVLGPPLYVALARDTRPAVQLPFPSAGSYRVYVADWGYHTSIIVQQPAGWRLGPPGKEGAPFLEYAWGDRRFYMESDYRPQAIFATLFLPTASVLYLDGLPAPPGTEGATGARAVFVRYVDAATLRALLVELERSIHRMPDDTRAPPYARTPEYRGRFYPAYGAYLWAGACNWWTVERLRGAGLAGSAAGVVFSGQVAGRLRGFRSAVASTEGGGEQAR
jgi:hypothetical protein